MMNYLIATVACVHIFFTGYGQDEVFRKWKTVDDETGKIKSVVEIFKTSEGKANGKIIKLYREPDEDQDPTCTACEDDRKDKRVIGMEILRDMEWDEDEWDDGTICDPNNGEVYDCKLWVEDGNLQVRGYLYFFFRTQEWLPYNP